MKQSLTIDLSNGETTVMVILNREQLLVIEQTVGEPSMHSSIAESMVYDAARRGIEFLDRHG